MRRSACEHPVNPVNPVKSFQEKPLHLSYLLFKSSSALESPPLAPLRTHCPPKRKTSLACPKSCEFYKSCRKAFPRIQGISRNFTANPTPSHSEILCCPFTLSTHFVPFVDFVPLVQFREDSSQFTSAISAFSCSTLVFTPFHGQSDPIRLEFLEKSPRLSEPPKTTYAQMLNPKSFRVFSVFSGSNGRIFAFEVFRNKKMLRQ